MDYSLARLKTKADCDALLASLKKEQKRQQSRALSNEVEEDNFDDTSVDVEGEIIAASANVQVYTTVVNGLAPGSDARLKNERLLEAAEHKLYTLNIRKESYGAIALIQKQLDVKVAQGQYDLITALISQVEAKKASLPA